MEKFNEANALFGAGDCAAALELLGELDTAYPDDKNILYARARCYAKLGEYDTAISLCEMCVERWDAPRAKQLLDSLYNKEYVDEALHRAETSELDLDSGLSPTFSAPSVLGRKRTNHYMALSAIVIIGTVAITWAVHIKRKSDGAASGVTTAAADFQAEFRRRAEARREQLEKEDGSSTEPGQEIPEKVWARNAVNGIPRWRPGAYRAMPCPGAYAQLPSGEVIPRTIDVYVPMAYQERPSDLFPSVIINWSSMNPGFIGLENWAEENDVVLVTVNTACNAMYRLNWQAQDAALATIVETMRLDTSMGFAIGMSGGAATSWEMICRYPNNFVGLVMMGISSGHNRSWVPQHVRVAYIYGQTDQNRKYIEQRIPKLRSTGNKVRAQVVSGGHVTGPLHVREQMLTWMLDDVRKERNRQDSGVSL